MAYNFIEYEQNQMFLLPVSILDWVKEDSLACFISDAINTFYEKGDLKVFFNKYNKNGVGASAYHPVMMLKILVFAYCSGITSSRVIAKKLENDVEMRYIAANAQPDFRTISDFRKKIVVELSELFTKVLCMCGEAKMIKLGKVSIDGTKIQANASLASNRTKEGIEKEVAEMLKKAEETDKIEDEKYGVENRGDELPQNMRKHEERKKRLSEAYDRLKQKEEQESKKRKKGSVKKTAKKVNGKEDKEKKPKANITDPESRIMKTTKGYIQAYNAQLAVDVKNQIIVACKVTNLENDTQQLGSMVEECKKQTGNFPKVTIADAGYWQPKIVEKYNKNTDLHVCTKKSWKQRQEQKKDGFWPCGRIPKGLSLKEAMERKLLTKKGSEIYKLRGQTVEPVIGQIKTRGCKNFSMRRQENANGEWNLWCLTHNLIKLWKYSLKNMKK